MPYVVCDEVYSNGCKHCAPMFIIEQHILMAPTANDLSATLTFIRFRGRTFGITCKHVVESLRSRVKESNNQFSHTFFIALKNHHEVQDRFYIPSGDLITPEPDIAIRELHPDFPAHVGKSALDIEVCAIPPLSEVLFAVAVGFPDRMKEQTPNELGYILSMPCIHAVADNRSFHEGASFSLFSELDSTPAIRDLSGLSGGPIYWSNESKYGLLGITYESSPLDGVLAGAAAIHIKGHLADLSTIVSWTNQVPRLYSI